MSEKTLEFYAQTKWQNTMNIGHVIPVLGKESILCNFFLKFHAKNVDAKLSNAKEMVEKNAYF